VRAVSTRRLFSLCLFLPLLLGVLGPFVPGLAWAFIFLFMGGVPYALTAVVLFALLRRPLTLPGLVRVSLLTPPAFAALCALEFALIMPRDPGEWVGAEPHQLLAYGGIALGVSAAFVAVAWLLWAAGRRLGRVTDLPRAGGG
jgi:hypothetical protein